MSDFLSTIRALVWTKGKSLGDLELAKYLAISGIKGMGDSTGGMEEAEAESNAAQFVSWILEEAVSGEPSPGHSETFASLLFAAAERVADRERSAEISNEEEQEKQENENCYES